MYAVISLESIGDNISDIVIPPWRPWVARITGVRGWNGLERQFVRGQRDYSQANSVGSRGVYLHFALKDGVYEVKKHSSWKSSRRYFISVRNGVIIEITREDVDAWLESRD